jgi:hypothetical protein
MYSRSDDSQALSAAKAKLQQLQLLKSTFLSLMNCHFPLRTIAQAAAKSGNPEPDFRIPSAEIRITLWHQPLLTCYLACAQ